MIIFREKEIKQEHFGDGTLKAIVPDCITEKGFIDIGSFFGGSDSERITWCYDSDSEIFTLQCLVDAIRDVKPFSKITLLLPYIPNARQDRKVSGRFFTLKSFAKLINSMNFYKVEVCDPHSDVSTALIDRVKVLSQLKDSVKIEDDTVLMYPDAGAAKKYNATDKDIIGNKHRNAEGRIENYELLNFVDGTKNVIIIDDICSYGGTFVAAAKALKEKGVERIALLVTHCEDNILKGDVFDYISEVYTTDSICHIKHEKLHFLETFRKVEEDDHSEE